MVGLVEVVGRADPVVVPLQVLEERFDDGWLTAPFDVSADTDVVYAFATSTVGAGALAGQLLGRVSTAGGQILYAGPLSEAAFSGRALPAGEIDQILVDVELSLETTAEGAAGTASLARASLAVRATGTSSSATW